MLGLRAPSVVRLMNNRNITSSLKFLPRCCPTLPQKRHYSEKEENKWQDGAVVYSTSKAAKHRVNTTIGFDEKRQVSYKPLVFGVVTFSLLMYAMFFYHGEKNDVFVKITPESIREQYLQSVNQTNAMHVPEDEGNEKKEGS